MNTFKITYNTTASLDVITQSLRGNGHIKLDATLFRNQVLLETDLSLEEIKSNPLVFDVIQVG